MSPTKSSMWVQLMGRLASVGRNGPSVIWNIFRLGFTVGLFFSGAYLIDSRSNVYLGLLLVGWSLVRTSTYVYRLSFGRLLLEAVAEARAAIRIEIYMKIDAILAHPMCIAAFQRLQALGRIPSDVTVDEWQYALLNRFRSRAEIPAGHQPWEHTVFEVRAGQLWVNGEYRRSSVIWHEILIPDESMKKQLAWEEEDEQYYGLRIRVFVLNGLLKVQVGKWDEDEGHRETGQQYKWIAWDTITTFPLLLNPLDHHLPPRFLLLDYFSSPLHRSNWAQAKRTFFLQADEYRRALSSFFEENGEQRIHDRQAREFGRWLELEGFTRTWSDEPPAIPSWGNRFIRVDFINDQSVYDDYDNYRWLSDESEKVY